MPCLLTNVLGHFVLEYASTGPKCNERSCLRAKAITLNLSYNPPWYIASKYFSFAMGYTPITGTRFNLRLPVVVGWTHQLWMHANQRNIVAIQKLFSEGKASPFDRSPLGGTALCYAAQYPQLYRFLVKQGANQELMDVYGDKPSELIGERLLSAEFDEENSYAISVILDETDFMKTRRFTILHKIVLGIVNRSLKEELDISTALIDAIDSQGRTPLAWATIRDDKPSVETLLNAQRSALRSWIGKLTYTLSTERSGQQQCRPSANV